MDTNEIIFYIIVPIVCAFIGGSLTLFGVILTIKNENKKNKESVKLGYKPFICWANPNQNFDYRMAEEYYFNYNNKHQGQVIEGIFKNTDNGLLILDSVSINNEVYCPSNGNIVDKNTFFYLFIYSDKSLKKEDQIVLNIKDVFNTEYKYNILLEVKEKKDIVYVTGLKEIK